MASGPGGGWHRVCRITVIDLSGLGSTNGKALPLEKLTSEEIRDEG
jgi:hypothetical protein